MVDTFAPDASKPRPLSACTHCGSEAFEDGRATGLSKEIFCRVCGAGYRVNVLHDGLFVVEEIGQRPRRQPARPARHRRRRTDPP